MRSSCGLRTLELLAAIGLVIFFVIPYVKLLPQLVMDKIGWGEKSGDEKPVTPDGEVPPENLPGGNQAPAP